MGEEELTALAAEAYVYGLPLVSGLSMADAFLRQGFGPLAAAPFNHFSHADRSIAPDDTRFVSVDTDSIYSIAQLDLSAGPVRLHVPDTGGAYYVLQFVDAWTNNFAYLGSRGRGTDAGEWLVVPPGWAGTVHDEVRGVIDAPTSVVTIIGRNVCDGPGDLPRVRALQQELTLTHLGPEAEHTGLPEPEPGVPELLRFFERLRVWMAGFPPAAADRAYQDRFQPLGLLEEGVSPYVTAGPVLVRALTQGLTRGKGRVAEASGPAQGADRAVPGAWRMNPHLFDYNLDHFGVGTLASPQWKLPDRTASYLVRAVAARTGLWGSHGYESVYAYTFQDSAGRRLDGSHDYVLRFRQPPPVAAFWSVTLYDVPSHRLVANAAGRYSVGDRTPGIVYGADGSLTLHLRREPPADPDEAANWLPAPDGEFRPVLRLYLPDQDVLDGRYVIPAIERL